MRSNMKTEELLKKLVQIFSPSGGEEKLAQFILSFCKENSISAKIQNGNVVIFFAGKKKDTCVIFNAHMDTVENGSLEGKIMNGKLYGLGASDDKGAIATMLLLAKTLHNPPCDIWFTFVCNEETDGSGSEKFLEYFKKTKQFKMYKNISAIIGEPTNLSHIEIGHRGNAFVKIEAFGKTGHGAKEYLEEDLALEKILKTLEKVKKEFKKWKKKYKDDILGEPGINITDISTKDSSLNKIPDYCSATLDIRTTSLLHESLLSLLKSVLEKDLKISFLKKPIEPSYVLLNSGIVRKIKKLFPKISFATSIGSTDQVFFIKNNIDAIVLGPGEKEVIHQKNEYIKLNNVQTAVGMYQKIIDSLI